MRIEEEVKLDYSDVLFRPKRSTLKSRKEVDFSRTYKFKHSNREWSGVPIIASNMDGVGELKVAKSLSKYNIMTSLTKQHNIESINSFPEIKDITGKDMGHYFFDENLCCWDGPEVIKWLENIGDSIG